MKTTYYANDTDTFDKQVPQCQLPRKVVTTWDLTDDVRDAREDTELSEYDVHGNPTLRVQANGITEITTWYPADDINDEKDDDKQIEGLKDPWGFVRSVRDKTVIPTSNSTLLPDVQAGAPTLRSRHRYAQQNPISTGSKPWIALVEDRMLQVEQETEIMLKGCVYSFFDEPADHLKHGRRSRQALTIGGAGGPTTFTDYTYSTEKATYATFAGETVLYTQETTTTDFDTVSKSMNAERSLFTGESLLFSDSDEQMRFTYDALGRVVSETEAPESDYPATRTFSYRLIRPAGPGEEPVTELASQELTDIRKVKTRSWFDGLARTIREELEDTENADGKPPVYRSLYEAGYDAAGQLISETEIDWLDKTDLRLTSTYTYDDWGMQDSSTGPDGVKHHSRSNPITYTTEQWVDGVGKTRTVTNRFDKPVSTETLDLQGRRISRQQFKYDGLGRSTQETDAIGGITHYRYDATGRMISSTLPDRTIVSRRYADHSSAELPVALVIKPSSNTLPAMTVGEQSFDGLERPIQRIVGNRVEQLRYEGGRLSPCQRVTPSGKAINYEYQWGLTTQPTAIKAIDDSATFDYDLLDGNLKQSSNDQGTYDFTYTTTGHLSTERWSEPGKPDRVTRFTSSLKGRQLTRTDVGGQTARAEYDVNPQTGKGTGRLLKVTQCQLQGAFAYDALGRLHRTTSTDLGTGNTLTTTLTFDDIGREKTRTLALRNAQGQPIQAQRSIELEYLPDGNPGTRHLRVGDATTLLETFEYDARGRLVFCRHEGDDLPKDRFGNAIARQFFDFDALNNINYCLTSFADGSKDEAEYFFAESDPCQMIRVTHTHPDYQGLKTDYTYDADGNLTHDEMGQQLHYDSQGRLLGVSDATGEPVSNYRYDGHDHLLAVKPQGKSETLRFYQGDRLSDTLQDGQHTQLLYRGNHPLGQQTPGDDSRTLLLLTDAKQSVIGESQDSELRTAVYSAYGERSSEDTLQSLLAFNGEVRDPESGWYLLGHGYRAYNPGLMRFHSPDSLSPFGAGGPNCYMYCAGNPIAFSDPTGHRRRRGGQFVNNPWFAAVVGGPAIVLGIIASVVTLNPAPLAAVVNTLVASTAGAAGASAATAATAGAVASHVVLAAASLSTTYNGLLNLGMTLFGIGVDQLTTFVKDENASEVLGYFGGVLAQASFVKFHVPYGVSFTVITPQVRTRPVPPSSMLSIEGPPISRPRLESVSSRYNIASAPDRPPVTYAEPAARATRATLATQPQQVLPITIHNNMLNTFNSLDSEIGSTGVGGSSQLTGSGYTPREVQGLGIGEILSSTLGGQDFSALRGARSNTRGQLLNTRKIVIKPAESYN
ncbi:hypothetical protein POF45_29405 [Pseudomonas sp. 681]|uniref:Teneurin-like YD-shell domain-containing protein n=1 Tax=Pseudomonas fungipugnans TaxID=3024217 RepID=A0ABT6QX70_9PSED|nr:RHS repeat-associated core domain-containing protein [Pseudomonas sp. 681]MDI2595510.1 hypothetical protein [Pseudomonas sp. 681]